MTKHFQVCKVVRDTWLLERLHERVIRVEISYDLEPALERDYLALEVTL